MGLLACASFVIVAVAANRTDPSRLDTRRRVSGAGGFNLMARSDLPIYVDLNTEAGRRDLGFLPETSAALAETEVLSFRASGGDDISCLNVQRPSTPRLLGLPHEFIQRGGFTFTESLARNAQMRENPWRLLEDAEMEVHSVGKGARPVIPAVADAVSARWLLHAALGDEIELLDRRGQTVRLRLVGLLADSIFASALLISEQQFVQHFGPDSGYQFFLIRTPAEQQKAVAAALRESLGEMGFDVIPTADALARYARVRNTYLATFQTLGGLGLLVGTFGIVAVLLRGVVERRGELALMLALGFRRIYVVAMILMESALLLLAGVVIGTVAALVATAPHLVSTQADVGWLSLAATLAACVLTGLLACFVAALRSVRGDLVAALRSE